MSRRPIELRKPTRPKLTPITGTPVPRKRVSARSTVPSPPSTTARSAEAASALGVDPVLRRLLVREQELDAVLLCDGLQPGEARADLTGRAVRHDGRAADGPTRRRRRRGGLSHRDSVRRVGVRDGRRTPGSPWGRAGPSLRRRASRHPSPLAASMTLSSTFRCTSGSRTTPLAIVGTARLELRLDEDERLPAGSGEGEHRGQRLRHRDERDVADDELGCERELPQRAGVHALEHGHARVRPEARVELPVADVDRDHARCPRLEETVGEARPSTRRRRRSPGRPRPTPKRVERVPRASPLRARRSDGGRSTSSSASSAICSPGLS